MPLFASPQVQRAWLSQVAVGQMRKRRTYFVVPAFSLVYAPSGGPSIAQANINYSFEHSFVIATLPAIPDIASGLNYCLAIRWRKDGGDEVFRYKLWENVGELFYSPLYNGEKIGKNFTLEVWDLNNPFLIENPAAFNIETSIRQKPDDISNFDDVQLPSGTLTDQLFSTDLNLPLVYSAGATGGDN